MNARERSMEVARELVDGDSGPTNDTGLLLLVAQGYLRGLIEGITRAQAAVALLHARVQSETRE